MLINNDLVMDLIRNFKMHYWESMETSHALENKLNSSNASQEETFQ